MNVFYENYKRLAQNVAHGIIPLRADDPPPPPPEPPPPPPDQDWKEEDEDPDRPKRKN